VAPEAAIVRGFERALSAWVEEVEIQLNAPKMKGQDYFTFTLDKAALKDLKNANLNFP
jgi:hypothetical protein